MEAKSNRENNEPFQSLLRELRGYAMTVNLPSQNPNRKLIETMTTTPPRNSNKTNESRPRLIEILIGNRYD
jgi:hypothetical protein